MARTHDDFVRDMHSINDQIEVIGHYSNSHERVRVRCLRCGKEWEPLAYSLLQGKSCSHCSAIRGAKVSNGKTALKTADAFKAELYETNPSITVIGTYHNTHTNIECQCNRCNHVWFAKPYSLLQGHGCPRCAKSGTSFMEQFIRLCFVCALGEENVLSRDRSLIDLELDIVVPKYKVAIEPGNWYLHQHYLKRDREKQVRCTEKGIRLFTIYDKFPKSTQKPFDCITYEVDLNASDHKYIQELINTLFLKIGIDYKFTLEEFQSIEAEAYSLSKCMTHEMFIAKIASIHPTLSVQDTFKTVNTRVNVKCQRCGYEWSGLPSSLLAGDGCRKCATNASHKKFLKDEFQFLQELSVKNPEIKILGTYAGRNNPIRAKCRICGFIWEPRASSLLRGSTHKGAKSIHKLIENGD